MNGEAKGNEILDTMSTSDATEPTATETISHRRIQPHNDVLAGYKSRA
jgi:hypothetical protein